MKLRIVSDLHLEWHPDGGRALVRNVVSGDFDVLVVAGDLADAKRLPAALSLLARECRKEILYTYGNHEFWGSDRESVIGSVMKNEDPHLFVMDGSVGVVRIDGQRFVGTPLWFRKSAAPKHYMNDFSQIRDFESWVYEENRRAQDVLQKSVEPNDVVITHYLPSERCVHPKWKGSPLNAFFVCDMDPLIKERRPKLWVHGHTHESVDSTVWQTRLVCNPYGYHGHEVNAAFNPQFTIEI